MSRSLSKKPKLLVISDTALVQSDGKIFGFGPVVKELEQIEPLFESITWIGYNRPDRWNDGSLIEIPSHYRCYLLKRTGGNTLLDKLKIIFYLPITIFCILKLIPSHQAFHTRGPSVPAFVGILCSFIFKRKIWWHKYAGNWIEHPMPIFYQLQKRLLLFSSSSKVTINGKWSNLPKHILPFENPCIHESEIKTSEAIRLKIRGRTKPYLVFVGSLNPLKGVDLFIKALQKSGTQGYEKVVFIGGGKLLSEYKNRTAVFPNVEFTGYLNRIKIMEYLDLADFIVLPSFSEGFPKVLAEAAAFGVIPVCTSISSIPHYITSDCGYLISKPDIQELHNVLTCITKEHKQTLEQKATNAAQMARLFTYERFVLRVQKEILN